MKRTTSRQARAGRISLAWTAIASLSLLLAGCPNEEGNGADAGVDTTPAETLDPEPADAPTQVHDGRLTCVGNNAPASPAGTVLELTGYVRTLADPDATKAPPAARVEAFTKSGTSIGVGFADPSPGKDGRVSVTVPITKAGFTGHTVVSEPGFLDWRFENSRPITDMTFTGWAWLTTADEVSARTLALGITQDPANGILVGAVHDCDGFGVEYAMVSIDGKLEAPLFVEGFDVVDNRHFTSDTGRFVVPNLSPGEVEVKAFGRLKKGGPLTLLSSITVTIEAGRISAAAMQPRAGAK